MDINSIDLEEKLQSVPNVKVSVFESLASTNEEIKSPDYPDYSLIAAKSQTNGKGRRGKAFSSSYGGLYFSLKLPIPRYDLCALTSLCAVAVLQAVEEISGHDTGIKWVNDIYMNGRKIAGILTETVTSGGDINSIIIGIGINTDKVNFPDEVKNIADSIENITNIAPDKNILTAKIVLNILELLHADDPQYIFSVCRKKSIIIGKRITIMLKDKTFDGIAKGIDEKGRLSVDTGNETIFLDYGEISIKL